MQSGVSSEEYREINRWIASDPHHAVAFARVQAGWEMSARLTSVLPGSPADTQPELIAPGEGAGAKAWPISNRRTVMAGLAAASVAAVAIPAIRLFKDNGEVFETLRGERRTLKLADGSKLSLNTASKVDVVMGRDERLVRLLQGEALFEVAHDPERSFVVATEDTRIQAIGTAFNVRVRADAVELTVTEGIVAVSNHASESGKTDGQARVMAGKGAVIRSGTVAVTPLDDRMVEQRVAWRDGVISLDGNSIEQAVEEFNRYRSAPIIIGDTRIASLRVGGRFECDESEKFIAALQRSFPIKAIQNNDKSVLLLPAG